MYLYLNAEAQELRRNSAKALHQPQTLKLRIPQRMGRLSSQKTNGTSQAHRRVRRIHPGKARRVQCLHRRRTAVPHRPPHTKSTHQTTKIKYELHSVDNPEKKIKNNIAGKTIHKHSGKEMGRLFNLTNNYKGYKKLKNILEVNLAKVENLLV